MTYFRYSIENLDFIGSNKSEIIDTLDYYVNERGFGNQFKMSVPNEAQIKTVSNLEISIYGMHQNVRDYLRINFNKSDFVLIMDPTAYNAAVDQIKRLDESKKRGALYKFNVTPILSMDAMSARIDTFFPETIVHALKAYNWELLEGWAKEFAQKEYPFSISERTGPRD